MTDAQYISDRLDEHASRIEHLEKQNAKLVEQTTAMQSELSENTADTRIAKENIGQVLDVVQSWQGAMKVLEGIGRFFRPLGFIAVFASAVVTAWVTLKNGITPK